MDTEHLADKARELFKSNSNWKTVGVGIKEVDYQATGNHSITLYVQDKKHLDDLDEGDIFPSSVSIDGVNYPTDVKMIAPLSASACLTPGGCWCYEGTNWDGSYVYFDPRPIPNSNWNTTYHYDYVGFTIGMPLSAHRCVTRPLIGGISCGTIPPNGYGGFGGFLTPEELGDHRRSPWNVSGTLSFGTLGGMVVDLDDYTVCAMTNAHVVNMTFYSGETVKGGTLYISKSGYTTYFSYLCTGAVYREELTDAEWTIGTNGTTQLIEDVGNFPVYQPGSFLIPQLVDGYTPVADRPDLEQVLSAYQIGNVKRTSLLLEQGTSNPYEVKNDTALVTISATNCKSAQDGNSNNYFQMVPGESTATGYEGTINGVDYGMEFATTNEINRLMDTDFWVGDDGKVPTDQVGTKGPPLFSAGARTGPVGTPGTIPSYPPGGTDWCTSGLSATDVHVDSIIAYGFTNTSYPEIYDSIRFRGPLGASLGGDSGSFLCAQIPLSADSEGTVTYTEWKIIGQVFAGGPEVVDDGYLNWVGLANRIDNISMAMNISAYRGDDVIPFATLENKQTRITTGYSDALTMTYDGKRYWQAGKTTGPAEDV